MPRTPLVPANAADAAAPSRSPSARAPRRARSVPRLAFRTLRAACVLLAALAPQRPLAAQSIRALMLRDDDVPGHGPALQFYGVAVDDAGGWTVEVRVPAKVRVLVQNGVVVRYEGEPLPEPPGSSVRSIDSVRLDAAGRSALTLVLDGVASDPAQFAVFRDAMLVVQGGELSNAPEVAPGTLYSRFDETKVYGPGHVVAFGELDDPAPGPSSTSAITRFELDAAGAILSEHVLFQRGDVVPGEAAPILSIELGPQQSDVNELGQVFFGARLEGSGSNEVLCIDAQVIAQKGRPSPIPGRRWKHLLHAAVGSNDVGGYVHSGSVEGDPATDVLLVKDGQVLAQEGEALPAIAPYALEGFGAGPLRIGNDDRALWYGEWREADGHLTNGLFLDRELVVRAGVTTVDGRLIENLLPYPEGLDLSPSGRFAIFDAVLDGEVGVFLYDSQGRPPEIFCAGDGSGSPCPCGNPGSSTSGCANSTGAGGELVTAGSWSVSNDDLVLEASGLVPLRSALAVAGHAAIQNGAGAPFGDGLRCVGMGVLRLGTEPADSAGGARFGPGLAAEHGFAPGDRRFFQVWYRDPVGSPCGQGFNLTSGLDLRFLP